MLTGAVARRYNDSVGCGRIGSILPLPSDSPMFRIKICGITRIEDATAAASAGADAIGLNFYERSPRRIDLETAQKIADSTPTGLLKIGVFVNCPIDEIRRIAELARLDAAQLHGDELPSHVVELAPLPVIRAVRCRDDLIDIERYLLACRSAGRLPDAILVDGYTAGEFGGVGRLASWDVINRDRAMVCGLPLILAGGLAPANVADAIAVVQPNGVDVASGVESAPGVKSADLIEQFVRSAKAAFSRGNG